MINTFLESYKREQATKARDLAYLMEDAEDEFIDECVDTATREVFNESELDTDEQEMKEMKELDASLDEIEIDEAVELQRIMDSKDGITFDQMIGLAPIAEN